MAKLSGFDLQGRYRTTRRLRGTTPVLVRTQQVRMMYRSGMRTTLVPLGRSFLEWSKMPKLLHRTRRRVALHLEGARSSVGVGRLVRRRKITRKSQPGTSWRVGDRDRASKNPRVTFQSRLRRLRRKDWMRKIMEIWNRSNTIAVRLGDAAGGVCRRSLHLPHHQFYWTLLDVFDSSFAIRIDIPLLQRTVAFGSTFLVELIA